MWQKLKEPLSLRQTLIVVLALTILAGLGYGLCSVAATAWHRRNVARAIPAVLNSLRQQRRELIRAIENYKKHYGFYPPFHGGEGQSRGVMNPLACELLGTRVDVRNGKFYVSVTKDSITTQETERFFRVRAFSNSLPFPTWPTNFMSGTSLAVTLLAEGTELWGVGANFAEAVPTEFQEGFQCSAWRYVTDPAPHNPGKFDIWIEVNAAGRHYVLGNWPEVE